jgi:hypothetical protein
VADPRHRAESLARAATTYRCAGGSQQADTFSQADPFFGFLVGYQGRAKAPSAAETNPRLARWNIRFQGIFDVQPQAAAAPAEDGGAVDPTDFTPFIASRKTFDVDMHVWYDWHISPNFRIGPYFAGGVTTFIDPNELAGDQVAVSNDGAASGSAEGKRQQLDLTRARVESDLDHYFESGIVGTFLFDNRKLFMQSMMLYGRYEALAGLAADAVTNNRFVAKLRVFPTGLDISATNTDGAFAPMFGIELNAGKGPDQLKFFTGVAVAVNKFKALTQ